MGKKLNRKKVYNKHNQCVVLEVMQGLFYNFGKLQGLMFI